MLVLAFKLDQVAQGYQLKSFGIFRIQNSFVKPASSFAAHTEAFP